MKGGEASGSFGWRPRWADPVLVDPGELYNSRGLAGRSYLLAHEIPRARPALPYNCALYYTAGERGRSSDLRVERYLVRAGRAV